MGDTAATDSYRVLLSGGEGEIVEKKSRFIATIRKCENEEEAVAFIEEMKKKYWDARHNCSAFIIGSRGELTRCSDDGEPSGTAGRPMLEVLTGSGIRNIAVVVTRYFGGTLLGTGGLVRAYTQAVKEGLAHCETGILRKGCELEVTQNPAEALGAPGRSGRTYPLPESISLPLTDAVREAAWLPLSLPELWHNFSNGQSLKAITGWRKAGRSAVISYAVPCVRRV